MGQPVPFLFCRNGRAQTWQFMPALTAKAARHIPVSALWGFIARNLGRIVTSAMALWPPRSRPKPWLPLANLSGPRLTPRWLINTHEGVGGPWVEAPELTAEEWVSSKVAMVDD